MKSLVSRAHEVLRPLGYKKLRYRFYKVENGFYKLIHFQAGAYGDYFFVNVGVHPVGLPQLLTGQLAIPDRPPEYACILRRRIEEIASDPVTAAFRSGSVSRNDERVIPLLLADLATTVETWLATWGSFSKIEQAEDVELQCMLSIVPALWVKGTAMLKFFCSVKLGHADNSQRYLDQYLAAPDMKYDFSLVDDYLLALHKATS